jgi:hypothetical protein
MKNQELIYYASRTKALLLLIGSIAIVAIGWWVKEEKPLIGWLCVVLCGLYYIPATLITMLLPRMMYLRLDPDGIEMCSIGYKNKIRWQDVESFKIASFRGIVSIRGAKMIAINYRASFTERKVARAVDRALSGMEGAIPNIYNVSLEELERVLNQWLERFGQVEAQTDV